MLLIVLVGILVIAFCLRIRHIYKYWERKDIAHLKPWPFVGNMAPNVFQKQALPHMIEDFYKAYPDKRYVGIYQFFQPVLLLRDPDLIKLIAVKEFNSFPDHNFFKPNENDKVANRTLFILSGKSGWSEMRATLSPSFTSSKLRSMFLLMEQCADQFASYFERKTGTITLDMKDVFTRYTTDVIATTAFGVTCNSLENPENDFHLMGLNLSDFTGLRSLVFFGYAISPTLMKLLNLKTFSEKATNFFGRIIKETIKIRQEKKIIRPDMVHLLMEARKQSEKDEDSVYVIDAGFAIAQESITREQKRQTIEITDDDILAQAIGFFLAGFDTSSILLSYLSYELAINSDIQEKVREEVNATLENCKGKLTYEAVLGMKYLDCVVSETLRLWPPAAFTDRTSITSFTIEPEQPDEGQLHLDSGTACWIPIYPIHRDSKYFPEPEKFKPERFNDENKHKIKPFTFLPFGVGPRNCIGSRFALLETKLLVTKLIDKFEIVPVEKTQIPVQFGMGIAFLPFGNMWLGLKRREVLS